MCTKTLVRPPQPPFPSHPSGPPQLPTFKPQVAAVQQVANPASVEVYSHCGTGRMVGNRKALQLTRVARHGGSGKSAFSAGRRMLLFPWVPAACRPALATNRFKQPYMQRGLQLNPAGTAGR